MSKATELAKRIMKEPEENWLSHLEDINLHKDFGPLYKLGYSQKIANTITCFIILSYDADSEWITLNRDRYEDKVSVLKGLGYDEADGTFKSIFQPIIESKNIEVLDVVTTFLLNQTDWRWQEVHSLLDYASKMIRFCNSQTAEKRLSGTETDKEGSKTDVYEDTDEDKIVSINTAKGKLLLQAIESRRKAEELILLVKKDYVKVDRATQQDWDFEFSDTVKEKYDAMSWRQYIRNRNKLKQVI